MLDIGWQEIFIIGGLALIVVGPKDLPRAMRTAMMGVRKVRGLAKDFQDGVDEMVREANLDDFKKEMEKIKQDEIERDLKHGVIDNTVNFDSVKDDLNKMADAPAKASGKSNEPEILNQNATATANKTETITANEEKPADKPAREPVKRKSRGGAKPAAKSASTAKAPAKKVAAKKSSAKKAAARKASTKKAAAKSASKGKA